MPVLAKFDLSLKSLGWTVTEIPRMTGYQNIRCHISITLSLGGSNSRADPVRLLFCSGISRVTDKIRNRQISEQLKLCSEHCSEQLLEHQPHTQHYFRILRARVPDIIRNRQILEQLLRIRSCVPNSEFGTPATQHCFRILRATCSNNCSEQHQLYSTELKS